MHRRSFLPALALVLLAALVASGIITSTSLASPPVGCVTNARTRVSYVSLAAAVESAKPGETLKVSGVCVGDTTIGKNLTIEGVSHEFAPPTANVLEGANSLAEPGSVLTVERGATVTLSHLVITEGFATEKCGGGISNRGLLTLKYSVVTRNYSSDEAAGSATSLAR